MNLLITESFDCVESKLCITLGADGGSHSLRGVGFVYVYIQLPLANPATVPVQQRCRKVAECRHNASPTTGLNWGGS